MTSLYAMLVDSFMITRQDLPSHVEGCRDLALEIVDSVHAETWDDEIAERCLSVIVLLDHVGAPQEAGRLLRACRAVASDPVVQTRFASADVLIQTRNGVGDIEWRPVVIGSVSSDVGARLAVNMELSRRYESEGGISGEQAAHLREPWFTAGPVADFALSSFVFDRAVFAARLSDAKVALGRMEQLTASIMAELGEDHPYLGLVLLTLASAKCSLAAVDGNSQDLRRYVDVLTIAVQRASAQLGTEHPQTIGGMANLAHIEFEIALASGSPAEVTQCLANLKWLEEHSWHVLGTLHPTAVILTLNAAVAELEAARQARSAELIEEAKRRLEYAAELAERRFGRLHPCTAIARSNAAAAGFDAARALRSRPKLEHMVDVLEDAVSKVSSSLGAGHATARALTRQLRTCRRMLASDNPWTDDPGGGTGTIVRTVEDEMWGLDDDYVPVYEASRVPVASSDAEIIAAIDATIKYFNDGDIVEGIVVAVDRDEVLLEIGYAAEGVIPASELSIKRDIDPADVVSVGDQVEALVLQKEDKEGRVILSKKRADFARAWDELERVRDAGESVSGTVIEVVKGGLIVDIGVRGFLPASLVELRRVRDLQPYVGRELEAKIIELDKNRNNVILSRRAWLEQTQFTAHREVLSQLQKSQVRKGVVSSIVDFGAFVDLGGVDGLVHVSELSWTHIDHPSEVVQVGQEVTVEVLEVDMDRERVSLSLRATQEDPWHRFARLHGIGQFVQGKVTKLVPFGAFVRVAEGIEGLLHISELADRHVETAEEVVQAGNQVVVKIVDIDLQRRRIQLSLKQANAKFVPEDEFDPTQYGMPAEYDANGDYIYPEGFDPEVNDWLAGYERQREEWESEYAKAQALYERHMSQVRAATAQSSAAMPVARQEDP